MTHVSLLSQNKHHAATGDRTEALWSCHLLAGNAHVMIQRSSACSSEVLSNIG